MVDPNIIRQRLSGHGDVTAHKNGQFTLSLYRPVGEFWTLRLQKAIRDEIPGAHIDFYRCRPAGDRAFEHHEIIFTVG